MSQLFDQLRVGVYWWLNRENGSATIKLDPKSGIFDLGGQSVDGRLRVNNANDQTIFDLDSATGVIECKDKHGNVTIRIDGNTGNIWYCGQLLPVSQVVA